LFFRKTLKTEEKTQESWQWDRFLLTGKTRFDVVTGSNERFRKDSFCEVPTGLCNYLPK
jgi:hypothetical protein